MIDFIKFYVLNKEQFERDIQNNPQISLKSTFDRNTGEASEYPKVGWFENFEIRITQSNATIKGSIHKYHNLITEKGDHNHNDFSYSQFEFALNDLCKNLGLIKEETKITNLEFGFNITTEKPPKEIIENNLLMYDFLDHNRNHKFRGKGSYKEFERTDYSIKIYDKSKQFKIKGKNILRIELKIINSRYLKNIGITSLNHLKKTELKKIFGKLLKHYNKLMIVDSITPPKGIRGDHTYLYNSCTNPNYWKNIKPMEGRILKKDFQKIIKKKHDKIYISLREKIINIYKYLINS